MTVKVARTNLLSLRPARAACCCSIAALLVFFGSDSLQNADRRRRDPDDLVPPHPHQGRPHRHLQAQRALRRGGPQEDQQPDARLARISEPTKMDPASDRSAVGGSPRGRRQGTDLGGLRLPLARTPTPCCGGARAGSPSSASTCSARRSTSTFPGVPLERLREAGLRAQRGGVGFYPTSGRPSCTWIPAACATGRACRRRSSRA